MCKKIDIDQFSDFMQQFQLDFNIIHHNIRSFTCNHDEFSSLLENIDSFIDVYVFSETWFDIDSCSSMNNFDAFHTIRKEKRCGGVSVYIRNSYKSYKLSNISKIYNTFEVCTVRVHINNELNIYVVGLYRPPNSNSNDFIDELSLYISDNFKPSDNILFVGDYNIDISQNSRIGQDLISLYRSLSFYPLITESTRVTEYSSTIIDHFWANDMLQYSSGVVDCNITDHHIIFLSFPIQNRSKFIKKYFRDHSNQSIQQFVNNFSNLCTSNDQNYTNLDDKVTQFSTDLYNIYDTFCPIRNKNFKIKNNRKPWLTKEIINLLNFKQFLYRDYKNNNIPYFVFNNFKNKLTNILKLAKRNYLRKKFRDCIGDSGKTWKNINSLYRNGEKSKNIYLSENGVCLTNENEVATVFNNYFATVAENLDRNIPVANHSPFSYLSNRVANPFFIAPSSEFEVVQIITAQPNKSCPIDEIPVFIYKQIIIPLSKCISNFYNDSILFGVYPSVLKKSRIIPIFKNGDNASKFNYRPISILSFLAKIFEKLMYSRLFNFINEQNIICRHQFGFRSGLCTSDAIVEYLDHVYDAINNNKKCVTIFLDFSRAFDTVNIDVLLGKLDHYGIRGMAKQWFSSYLVDRPRYVSIGGAKSDLIEYNIGVPQGSVLGPVLFTIYINDMYNACKQLQLIHYADDTTAFISGKNMSDLVNTINLELDCISQWLQSNRLTLNVKKSSYMIHGHSDISTSNICIRNENLVLVQQAKFLGITIDDKLKFEEHANNVVTKLSRISGIIWKSKDVLPKRTLRMLYLSLGWSQINYGILAWGKGNKTYTKKVCLAQNRIVRNLYGSTNFSIYKRHDLLPFDETYELNALIKLYKELKMTNMTNPYFIRRIQDIQPDHNYSTRFRTNQNLIPPRINKSKYFSSFLYNSTHFWNNLPNEIKNAPDVDVFKNRIKKFIMNRNQQL